MAGGVIWGGLPFQLQEQAREKLGARSNIVTIGQDIWAFLAFVQEDVGCNQMRTKTCSMLIQNQEPALQQSAGNSVLAGWTPWVFRAWGSHSAYWVYKVEMVGISLTNKYLQTSSWGRCISSFVGKEPRSLIYGMEKM